MGEHTARKIANQYKVGSEVKVHYNPKNPGDAMVNPGTRWVYFPWLLAAAILIVAWAIATGRVGW